MLSFFIFRLKGRADSQIKVRGHRVDMSEIEKTVANIPLVDRVAVLVYKANEPMQKVLCYFTVKPSQTEASKNKSNAESILTELSLIEKLKSILPDYMMPNNVAKLTAMPLLVNGKFLLFKLTLLRK